MALSLGILPSSFVTLMPSLALLAQPTYPRPPGLRSGVTSHSLSAGTRYTLPLLTQQPVSPVLQPLSVSRLLLTVGSLRSQTVFCLSASRAQHSLKRMNYNCYDGNINCFMQFLTLDKIRVSFVFLWTLWGCLPFQTRSEIVCPFKRFMILCTR